MARIIVTTDNGQVYREWTEGPDPDDPSHIGDLRNQLHVKELGHKVRDAALMARSMDLRDATGARVHPADPHPGPSVATAPQRIAGPVETRLALLLARVRDWCASSDELDPITFIVNELEPALADLVEIAGALTTTQAALGLLECDQCGAKPDTWGPEWAGWASTHGEGARCPMDKLQSCDGTMRRVATKQRRSEAAGPAVVTCGSRFGGQNDGD